jgi:alcohol dehydrogenase class IV
MEILARTLDLPQHDFDAVLSWLVSFLKDLGIQARLADIGIPADRAKDIGAMAIKDPSAGGNPVQLSAAEYAELFLKAQSGELGGKKKAA